MVKSIHLSQGKFAIVDEDNYEELNKYKWYASKEHSLWYAKRNTEQKNRLRKKIRMHHQVTGFKHKMIDHINGNGLDNRECNLRPCNHSQNSKNSCLYKTNTSGLRGVYWITRENKWEACIKKEQKRIHIGYFDKKDEAGRAVDKKALELFGEFAVLNSTEVKR